MNKDLISRSASQLGSDDLKDENTVKLPKEKRVNDAVNRC